MVVLKPSSAPSISRRMTCSKMRLLEAAGEKTWSKL
jgi:hypothetical protein